jgi:hypothetical protein
MHQQEKPSDCQMNSLDQILLSSSSHLLIISACSAKKNARDLAKQQLLKAKDLDDPTQRQIGETRLANYRLPASEMYTGDGHRYTREAINLLRGHDFRVSHFILSAGYGLLNECDEIVPYDVTFSGAKKDWIGQRGRQLQLRDGIVKVANEHDQLILILGREYLEAIGLPLPTQSMPPVFAYIAPSLCKRIGSEITTVSVGRVEQRKIRAYSSSAKEKQFLVDVERALQAKATYELR